MYIFCINIHIYVRSDFLTYQGVRRYKMAKDKVVLAYSGGLDTTAIIPWLKENFDYEVVCVCIDCGQGEELDGLDERAKLAGASKLYIEKDKTEDCLYIETESSRFKYRGNISQIENIYEVFANSKYLDLASKAIERKKKCKQECSLYPICNGGCNANFYDESDITSNDSWFCRFNRSFLPWMIGTIHEFYQKRKIKNGALLKLCNEHFENLISVSKSIGLGEL